MSTPTRKVRLFAVALGAASALAIAGASLDASPASAFPITVCSPGGCATVCRQVLANGNVVDYPEGTRITVTNPDGGRKSYTCRNGEWVATARSVASTSGLVTSVGALRASPGGPSPVSPTAR